MTRRKMIQLLKTEPKIDCLTQRAYLLLLALKIEISAKTPAAPLAELVKAWE